MEKYNGWKNWETWNIHLWLTSDETLYAIYTQAVRQGLSYVGLVCLLLEAGISETADGVSYGNPVIGHREISKLMRSDSQYCADVVKDAAGSKNKKR